MTGHTIGKATSAAFGTGRRFENLSAPPDTLVDVNGSVTRLTQDRPSPWRARYRAPDGRERSRTFRRKVDAERWLRNELAQADRGLWVDPSAGQVTFDDWSSSWLAGLDLKPSTRANYESNLRSRVLPRFGQVRISRISSVGVRSWLTGLREEGLSPASVRQARQILHAALEVAVIDGILGRNPTDGAKPPTVRPRRQLFLSENDLEKLAVAAEERQAMTGAFVMLLGWSGLR